MEELDKVIDEILDVINNSKKDGIKRFTKTYLNTNEDLVNIFKYYDFKDKEVLSVLASSDQIFSSYFLGAKNVDTLDVNMVTYYYFFLRKWSIMYTKMPYLSPNNFRLIDCLEMCDNNNLEEVEAKYVWSNVLKRIKEPLYFSDLFFFSKDPFSVSYKNDIDKLIEIIKDKRPNFREMNLFKDNDFNKQYDIIILSNILEYTKNIDNDVVVKTVIPNLLKALKDDGVIICSSLINRVPPEKEMFSEYFTHRNISSKYSHYLEKDVVTGYSYTKKRH